MIDEGNWEFENWTYTVYYYDEEMDKVDSRGLCPLIRRRSQQLAGDAKHLQTEVEEQLAELDAEIGTDESHDETDTNTDQRTEHQQTETETA